MFCKYVSPRLELILNQLIKVKRKLVIGFLVDAGPAKLLPSGDTFNFCGFLLICATDKVSGVSIADYVFSQVNSIEGCLISTTVGGFLFSKISESPIVHVPKLFPLLHWFQNTFCFLCSSTPSHGGSFFLKIAIYNGDMAGGISNNRFWAITFGAITFDWSDLRT